MNPRKYGIGRVTRSCYHSKKCMCMPEVALLHGKVRSTKRIQFIRFSKLAIIPCMLSVENPKMTFDFAGLSS